MDQDAFRTTYKQVNERFCAFEKSVLTNQCNCSQAEKFCIAEREGVHCRTDDGQTRCLEALDNLREQARFALHSHDSQKILPHGKAIRIQVGGMRGVFHVLNPEAEIPNPIPDINTILLQALQKFGDFSQLPYSLIMQQIAAYQVKKRSRRKDRDT